MEGERFDGGERTGSSEMKGNSAIGEAQQGEGAQIHGRGLEREGREIVERKIEGKMGKQRGGDVFIVRESDESASSPRHARRGRAKPDRGGPYPETATRGHFTRTKIIF